MQSNFLKQSTEQRRDLILKGSVFSTILFLSVPTLMMGLIQSAIPVIDGLFLNNLVGTQAASAVTYCTPIVNMVSALAQGVSVAGMAIIGQSNGNGDFNHSRKISLQIIVFTFLLGFLLAPLLIALAFPISAHVNKEISHDVFLYLALSACVTPFSFMESIYNSIKNANGKPEDTFVRMVIMLILKIIFSALFIVVFHWGLVGSVMASLASNFLITLWMYYELFLKETGERFILTGFRFDWSIINTLLRIGFPAMLSSLMLNLGFFLINNEVEKYGSTILNGQGIANNITSICFILPSSFGSAVTTMVSMNVGAKQPDKAKKALFCRLRHKRHHCCPFNCPCGASVIKAYGVIYQRRFCPCRCEPGASYLYIFRGGLRHLHGPAGSFYRTGENPDHPLHQPAAGVAIAVHIYTCNRALSKLLFGILGQPVFQLHGRNHYNHPDSQSEMGFRY